MSIKNYIVTIGHPGSGKTTFQNFLIRYIVHGNKNLGVMPINIRGNMPTKELMRDWQEQWTKGDFSPATSSDEEPDEFAFSVEPHGNLKKKPNLEFGLFEIAGEHIEKIKDIDKDNEKYLDEEFRHLPDNLRLILGDTSKKIIFVFIADGDQGCENKKSDDVMCSDFFEYLEKNILAKEPFDFMKKNHPVLFLVSKPTDAILSLQTQPEDIYKTPADYNNPNKDICNRFLNCYTNNCYWYVSRNFKIWAEKTLNLGYINKEGKLVNPDYTDIDIIFKFIYKHFTKKSLDEGFLGRKLT